VCAYIYARRGGEGGGEVSPLLQPWLLITPPPATSVGVFFPFLSFRPPAQLPDCPGEVVVDWLEWQWSSVWNIPRRAGEGVNPEGRFRMCASGCSGFCCWYSVVCSEMWRAGGRWLAWVSCWRWSRGRRRSVGRPRQTARPATDMPRMQQPAVRLSFLSIISVLKYMITELFSFV
jgi:hypothetical protein